ncbi:cupin domain-containing protein [Streptosporangium sp. NBC_01755]|uniref:helix-turn-helix domain-containing protein n=1 Tax=unclassified Streptosporangium TaxID=2632669 RepID=UPI002DD99167|nr:MULTISPECIES: cupin domain-containing protein [unclassified Streptosporangium]WSA26458.1 cupin domain-containing protein [Streptosporangium sp. NBC_01810]WSD02112.1 cupin domain-containing protein [Streptosporangium sp. NBC_01755]
MSTRVAAVVSGIGPKIKALRKQNGYSLQSLAERADVSAATIHKIEQADMVPTITTLLKIAVALERPVSYFVEDDDEQYPTVFIPAENRRPIYTSHAGIDLAGISGPYGDFLVAAAMATVIPGASSGSKPMQHLGEELVYLVAGRLEFEVGGVVHVLNPGDSLHFRTQQPHSWRNPADEDASAIWMALRPQQ